MSLAELLKTTHSIVVQMGFFHLSLAQVLMWGIGLLFVWLAIAKGFEPLLLLPIGFGIFIVNFPLGNLMDTPQSLLRVFFHYGLEWDIIPCLIFLGLGALTDFGPLIANPKTMIIGAGAQFGVFVTFVGTILCGFTLKEAASVSIIGGADGPTTIYLTMALAPHLLGANALAAYSYMSMVPLIQPPIMRLMISSKERSIRMRKLRPTSKTEKILFPIIVFALIGLVVPSIIPLMSMFMLGNLMLECGVVNRLADTSKNALMNIVTIFLGVSVGATMSAKQFLSPKPLLIFALGLLDFAVCTFGGIVTVKIMNLFLKEKINPLIGSAGVSAVPMSARVSQRMASDHDPENFVLMHAMGPNVAGVIGTAAAAGFLIAMFAK